MFSYIPTSTYDNGKLLVKPSVVYGCYQGRYVSRYSNFYTLDTFLENLISSGNMISLKITFDTFKKWIQQKAAFKLW